jgi:hypothetical protein
MGIPISPADRKAIVEMIEADISIRQIAERTGRDPSTIRKFANRLNPGAADTRRPWTKNEDDILLAEMWIGTEWIQISRMLHRTINACQVHYQDMLKRTAGTEEQESIIMPDRYGNSRRAAAVQPKPRVRALTSGPGDPWENWSDAMQRLGLSQHVR